MKSETALKFSEALSALYAERDEINKQITTLEGMFGTVSLPAPSKRGRPPGRPAGATKIRSSMAPGGGAPSTGARRGRKPKGELSLKEAIIRVTQDKALTKDEILNAVQAIGYKFTTDKPVNSINQVVYNNKDLFKNDDGKFRATVKPSAAPSLPLADGTGDLPHGNRRTAAEEEPHIKTYTPEELEGSAPAAPAPKRRGRKPGKGKK